MRLPPLAKRIGRVVGVACGLDRPELFDSEIVFPAVEEKISKAFWGGPPPPPPPPPPGWTRWGQQRRPGQRKRSGLEAAGKSR